jgi:hypothetical protein
MHGADRCSKFVICGRCECTILHPNGTKLDYIHTWLNKWRMQGNFKSKVMVFHPKEGVILQRCRRRTAGTPGRTDDQVSKYKYLGVVYQEDGSWQAHAQGAKMQAAYGY